MKNHFCSENSVTAGLRRQQLIVGKPLCIVKLSAGVDYHTEDLQFAGKSGAALRAEKTESR
jgi:hypothetical protein